MGQTPFEDPRYPAGSGSIAPAYVPSVPSYDIGSAGPRSRWATRMGTDARWALTQDPEYSRPEVTSELNRGLRYAANKTPFGVFVDDPQAASWKEITMEEINNNPEWFERWKKLSDQDRAFVLMDGSNKLIDIMSAPPAMYERLMGSTSTEKVGDKLVTQRTPGMLPPGRGLPSPTGAPQPGQGGPGPAQSGRRRVAGQAQPQPGAPGAGAPQAGQLRREAGQPYTSSVEDYGPDVQAVVIAENEFGLKIGQQVMLSPAEFRAGVNQKLVQAVGDKPTEIGMYRKRNPKTGVADEPAVPFSNAAYRANKQLQKDYVLAGAVKEGIGPGGKRGYFDTGTIQTSAPGAVGVESAFKPTAYYDAAQSGKIAYPTPEMLTASAAGRYTPVEQTTREITKDAVTRATSFRQDLAQTKLIIEGLANVGRAGMSIVGKLGVAGANLATLVGKPELGDQFAKMMGSGNLSAVELGVLQKTLLSWVNKKKMEFLNDQRISGPDQKRLDRTISANEALANKEQIEEVVLAFTEFGLIRSELELAAAGQASQYPVTTKEEYNATVAELVKFSIPPEKAEAWALNLMDYSELRYSGGQPSLEPK